MNSKVISLSEMEQGNKRNCWSILRALGKCYKCNSYAPNFGGVCESRVINEEVAKLNNYKHYITEKYKQEIENIDNKINKI